jgi:hypothetical protein
MTSKRPLGGRFAFGLVLLAGIGLGAGIAWTGGRLPRVSDLWPLDLDQPGGWLVDRQLADLRDDPKLCLRVLDRRWIEARAVADQSLKAGCGWRNAVQPTAFADARIAATPVTCEVAAALSLWMAHVVQPAAAGILGSKVVGLDHLGSFACRNVRGSPAFANRPSEHASANALDVGGFRLADGRRVRVATDWGRDAAESRFLAAVQKGACRYFRVAIGPNYNAAHRDHFHLDRGRWHACR